MIPLKLFRERVFNAASSIGFVMGFAMFGALTFLPLYMQIVKGVSPTASGLRILPLMLGMLGASVISGRLVTRWGRYKVFPVVGTALMTIGAYLLSMIDASTNGWVLAGYMFVFGVGMGLVMQVLVVAVQNAVSYEDLGVATSSSVFFRMIGGSFGTAVFGAIYAIVLNHTIAPTLAKVPASVLKNFNPQTINPGVLNKLKSTAAGLFFYTKYIDAVTHAIQVVFLVAVPIAFVAFLLSWLLPEVELRKTVQTVDVGEVNGFARPAVRRCRRLSWRSTRSVGPGEPGRALPDAGHSGRASICRRGRAGCSTGWPISPPARSTTWRKRLKVGADLIQPGVDGLLAAGMIEERRRGVECDLYLTGRRHDRARRSSPRRGARD